jgi:hypothetical protein
MPAILPLPAFEVPAIIRVAPLAQDFAGKSWLISNASWSWV